MRSSPAIIGNATLYLGDCLALPQRSDDTYSSSSSSSSSLSLSA